MAAYQKLKMSMDSIQPNPAMGQPNAWITLCQYRTWRVLCGARCRRTGSVAISHVKLLLRTFAVRLRLPMSSLVHSGATEPLPV